MQDNNNFKNINQKSPSNPLLLWIDNGETIIGIKLLILIEFKSRVMTYKSAIDSISCILSDCDPETRGKVHRYINENYQMYDEIWCKKHGILSHKQMRQKIIKACKLKTE